VEKQQQLKQAKTTKFYQILLVVGIILASCNLRPAITAVGPLLKTIGDDFGMAHWGAGLLTTLPLLAFAFLSPIVPRIGARLTNELAIVIGIGILIIGMLIRTTSFIYLLFLGTLIAGAGIAILNVLIPGVIKQKFPLKVGLLTGIYSTTMSGVAGISSGFSVPLAKGQGWGWKWALLVWVIPAFIGLFVWIFLLVKEQGHRFGKGKRAGNASKINKQTFAGDRRIWKSSLAWQMAFFMALQSFLYYVTISWLPAILQNNGFSESGAGWMLTFMQIIGLPASFLVPVLADRLKGQAGIVIGLCTGMLFGYGALLFGHTQALMLIGTGIIGLCVNGNFSLALAFFGLRARNAKDASELSGMAQSFGYLLSALGPTLIGLLYDQTSTWTIPLYVMLAAVIVLGTLGLSVGRDRYVFDEPRIKKTI